MGYLAGTALNRACKCGVGCSVCCTVQKDSAAAPQLNVFTATTYTNQVLKLVPKAAENCRIGDCDIAQQNNLALFAIVGWFVSTDPTLSDHLSLAEWCGLVPRNILCAQGPDYHHSNWKLTKLWIVRGGWRLVDHDFYLVRRHTWTSLTSERKPIALSIQTQSNRCDSDKKIFEAFGSKRPLKNACQNKCTLCLGKKWKLRKVANQKNLFEYGDPILLK